MTRYVALPLATKPRSYRVLEPMARVVCCHGTAQDHLAGRGANVRRIDLSYVAPAQVAHTPHSFPDIAYFRDAEVQAELTNILYLYSDMHPDIGYRQGMHELLAPLYFAVDCDSISEDADLDPATKEFCARAWVAADAWLLFDAVMKGAGRWYEWQEGKAHADPGPLPSHVQLNVSGDTRVKQYIAPIVEDCNRVQSVLLKGVDPELWKALQTAGIEPQIYGM